MALKGVKVLEFVGLAPAPFCGKILADFGATVTRIDRQYENQLDVCTKGKSTLAVNIKDSKGQALVRNLSKKYDVLIDCFRPGVLEKLNLGPDILCKENPKLIYARLTGFGQSGKLALRAGHDINYVALSGVLSMLGRQHEKPYAPINLLADFSGGSVLCALGICLALLERHHSGRGQIVDSSMTEGTAYIASWLFMTRNLPFFGKARGTNIIDGGSYFYDTYETKDGKYMSVGSLESQFFEIFKERLGLPQLTQYISNEEEITAARKLVTSTFLQKTQEEWARIFEDVDACVVPVVEVENVMAHEHNRQRNSYEKVDDLIVPRPAPRLSRTPGELRKSTCNQSPMEETLKILREINVDKKELQRLVDSKVVLLPEPNSKL